MPILPIYNQPILAGPDLRNHVSFMVNEKRAGITDDHGELVLCVYKYIYQPRRLLGLVL